MTISRILIAGLLTVVGFIVTPLTFAFAASALEEAQPQEINVEQMTMAELLKSEQESIASFQSKSDLIAATSLVGAAAGAALGLAVTRKSKSIVPVN